MPESAENLSNKLKDILHSAHGSYEQKKIILKNKNLKKGKAQDNKKMQPNTTLRHANKVVRVNRGRTCPKHKGKKLNPTQTVASLTIFDLVFSSRGVKKQLTKYIGNKGYCSACRLEYNPPQIRKIDTGSSYGHGFKAWVCYHRLALRLPYNKIVQLLYDTFGERVNESTIHGHIVKISSFYTETEQILLDRILSSPFIHMDETTINIRGVSQYVWVITDGSHVIFKLTENREAKIVHELLNGYTGVLCTDFYGGYDSVPCAQQKCWSHLIGDINDDLRKSPFDSEFENFVGAVGDLITPILQAVERYGSKARNLRKFKMNVDKFYDKYIDKSVYGSDTTRTYQKRFIKYRDKLFVFLNKDGIPWNNNAAERALRHLAVQRKISGTFGPKTIESYLRLLSVTQTCRFQNKSLLQFLLSGEKDIDSFKDK